MAWLSTFIKLKRRIMFLEGTVTPPPLPKILTELNQGMNELINGFSVKDAHTLQIDEKEIKLFLESNNERYQQVNDNEEIKQCRDDSVNSLYCQATFVEQLSQFFSDDSKTNDWVLIKGTTNLEMQRNEACIFLRVYEALSSPIKSAVTNNDTFYHNINKHEVMMALNSALDRPESATLTIQRDLSPERKFISKKKALIKIKSNNEDVLGDKATSPYNQYVKGDK